MFARILKFFGFGNSDNENKPKPASAKPTTEQKIKYMEKTLPQIKQQMLDNLDTALKRGEMLESLQPRTQHLRSDAVRFKRKAEDLDATVGCFSCFAIFFNSFKRRAEDQVEAVERKKQNQFTYQPGKGKSDG